MIACACGHGLQCIAGNDNDGVKNRAEYALVDGGERGVLGGNTITFTKRGGVYRSDVTYGIETSTDLSAGCRGNANDEAPASYWHRRSSAIAKATADGSSAATSDSIGIQRGR